MKNNGILFGLLLSIAWCGCKRQLNLLPTDSIPPDKAFTNIADLQKGLEGVYEENTGSSNKVYIGSILADEVKIGSSNNGHGTIGFKWQYTPDDAGTETEYFSDFAAYYSMIDAINKELASIGNVTPKNDAETAVKKRINGELIGLRGIAHFEVLIRFMSRGYDPASPGVPIMLRSDLLGQPARAKVGDVIAQVRTDLAIAGEDTAIPDNADDVTRLSRATIAAYQARVSMLTGSWDSVIVFARQALNISGKTLSNTTGFPFEWTDSLETESLWKYRNQATPQLYWATPDGTVYFSSSDKLINAFDRSGNDVRFGAYFKPVVAANGDTTFLVNKYPGSQIGPQVNDIMLVRVGELYLDLAEAFAKTGNPNDLSKSRNYLDTLREARIQNNPDLPAFISQADAIQAVSDERFRELCFEGFRFFDLKRNALPVVRLLSDAGDPKWLMLQATDPHFALPIPQHEIFANPNMLQNPGY
jgi:hypothetical protein